MAEITESGVFWAEYDEHEVRVFAPHFVIAHERGEHRLEVLHPEPHFRIKRRKAEEPHDALDRLLDREVSAGVTVRDLRDYAVGGRDNGPLLRASDEHALALALAEEPEAGEASDGEDEG